MADSNKINLKPAYELDGISIVFVVSDALGDSIMKKKVFEAIIDVEKNCKIDLLCTNESSLVHAKILYADSKNFNRIIDETFFHENFRHYDLVLNVIYAVHILYANDERIRQLSPALFQSLMRIALYNRKYINKKDFSGTVLFNLARARILELNCYTILSSEGALPIYDNRVEINLSPQWENEFKKLGLKKYITVGSNGGTFQRHLVKEYPIRYYAEFIALLKSKMPDIEVVQTGGGRCEKIENADKYLLGENLELIKYVFKNSLLHVDCEGGPVHLASQLGTKCVVLFGATDIKYFGYKRNINLSSDICSPCYQAWITDQACMRGSKEPLCMLALTPQKIFDVTYRYLKSLE